MRPLNDVEQQVLALLKAAKGSLNLKQIGQKMPAITGRELGVALDTLTLRDLVERIDTGRDVSFAALAAPAAAALVNAAPAAEQPAVAPPPAPVAVNPASTAEINGKRVLAYLSTRPASGSTGREIFEALNIRQDAFSVAVRGLEAKGQVIRVSAGLKAPLYALSPSAEVALNVAAEARAITAATTEPTPGSTTPAVQPIDTATSTAAPAACPTHAAVTEPTGPRDGLSSFENAGEFEPAADELLAWHAQRAEQEAARRRQAAGEPAAVVFGDLNELFAAPPLALPNAMRNTGESELGELGIALTHTLVDSARFALWSDGVLEIDGGDDRMTLAAPATRALLDYLDRVCATAQH